MSAHPCTAQMWVWDERHGRTEVHALDALNRLLKHDLLKVHTVS